MRPLQPVQRMHAFPADVQKMCRRLKIEKSYEEFCDSSLDFGTLVGTRIPGPLIKSAGPGFISKDGSFELSLFFHNTT